MKGGFVVATLLVLPMMILSAWAITASSGGVEPLRNSILAEPPDYVSGYGFDPVTQTMEDTNGFRYSYQPDGIIQLDLPWGYTTHFSFGLTADYLGGPEKRTALDYTWNWSVAVGVALNETGSVTGYDYAFTATNLDGVLDWTIQLEFSATSRMKVTHTLENGYAQDLTNVSFWYLFDLQGTATPYTIETSAGTVEGPLYQAIPDGIHWVRLANQFQFDWSDALVDYENGHAYIGDGSVVGLDGVPILGISLELGDMAPGAMVTVDPYFSGLEKTWDAAGDAQASAPASWDPVGVLSAGDNVTFDATSVTNCDWNVEITLGNFSMLTGYSGTVTQGVDFGCVDFAITQGTFTGSTSFILTCEGNFTHTSGTVTNDLLRLTMTGTATTLKTSNRIAILEITGTTTLTASVLLSYNYASSALKISGILHSATYILTDYYPSNAIISGEIDGNGIWAMRPRGGASTLPIITGTISVAVTLYLEGNQATSIITLTDDFSVDAAFTFHSEHTTNTITLEHGSNYILSVSGVATFANRVIINQGTGAWSFGSYSQTGVDSIFNQGAALTIGTRFTISDGEFVATDDDLTVPGNWSTDGYTHGDNAVYLTGDEKTLDMAATESFFNVTIASGANYTMDDNTTVDQRATITGTLYGAGDFKEPLPEFTSEGWPHACPMELYEYEPTQTYWDTLDLVDEPYWLHLIDGVVTGVPNDNDTGLYYITLTLTWNDMVTYQNYTLIVCPELLTNAEITMLGVGLSIVLGFGLIVIGFAYRMPHLIVFSGLIWLISAVTVYKDISVEWTIITIGLGVMVLAGGGLQLVDESTS